MVKAYSQPPALQNIQDKTIKDLIEKKEFQKAEKTLTGQLPLSPNWDQGHFYMGCVLKETGRKALAIKAFSHATKLNPIHHDAWSNLSELFFEQQQFNNGLFAAQKALNINPKLVNNWIKLIDGLEACNLLDGMKKALLDANKLFPEDVTLKLYSAKLKRRENKIDDAIKIISKFENIIDKDQPNNAFAFYEIGQIYDRAKNYSKAFKNFEIANNALLKLSESFDFDKDIILKECSKLISIYNKTFIKKWAAAPDVKTSPVFLVGFPRSGTTLLDQFLNNHKDIEVAEEKPPIATIRFEIIKKFGEENYPECLADLSEEDILGYREIFFKEHQKNGAQLNTKIFIDKLPLNLFNAGLIHRIFPESKFILSLRHPCDSALSCYIQAFDINEAMVHFLDLKQTANFYDRVFSAWEHLIALLPLSYHEIKYEDLVKNSEETMKSLISFLELNWDKDILDHQKNVHDKKINTPSYSQVTEKLYTRSIERWHNYKKELKDELDILMPWADKFGYNSGSAK
jgi:tetratricopeptide (TPR) repeat protein